MDTSIDALDTYATVALILFEDFGKVDTKTKKAIINLSLVNYLDDPDNTTPLMKQKVASKFASNIRFSFEKPLDPELVEFVGISLEDVIKKKYEHRYSRISDLAVESFAEWRKFFPQLKNVSWGWLAQVVRENTSIASTPKEDVSDKMEVVPHDYMNSQFFVGKGPYENIGDYHISKAQWNKFWNVIKSKVNMKNLELSELKFHPVARLDHSVIHISVKCWYGGVTKAAKDTVMSSADIISALEPLYLRVIKQVDAVSPPTY
jgi:hypothetical protein